MPGRRSVWMARVECEWKIVTIQDGRLEVSDHAPMQQQQQKTRAECLLCGREYISHI